MGEPEITPTSTRFPNKAGDHADTDDILRAELRAAGIPTLQEAEGAPNGFMADLLRRSSGEVKTSVRGTLHGWKFERAWYYWMCSGPGIDVTTAERLHATHGRTVRVDGHCGCPSPREWFKGLACGSYHVDDAEGLKALADTIRALVAAPSPDVGQAAPEADAAASALRALSDVDPVVLAAWKLQGRKVGAMLADAQAAVIELQEELDEARAASSSQAAPSPSVGQEPVAWEFRHYTDIAAGPPYRYGSWRLTYDLEAARKHPGSGVWPGFESRPLTRPCAIHGTPVTDERIEEIAGAVERALIPGSKPWRIAFARALLVAQQSSGTA
jgi:hypothetical protein